MKYVGQETPHSCGAACVAMVAGVTWEEGVKVLGTRGLSGYTDLRRALDKLGIEHGSTMLLRGAWPAPAPCVVTLTWPNGRKHFVVWDGLTCWDPAEGLLTPADYGECWHPTSYMTVTPRPAAEEGGATCGE